MLVPTCLIASAAGHLFGNECLGRDHAESGMMQPLPYMHCWALSSTQRWQRWDHFRLCDVSLHCDKWERELEIDLHNEGETTFHLCLQHC